MAIDAPSPKSPEAAGKEFATHINDAVNRNDSKLYADTMAGINDWTKQHGTDKSAKFEESLIGSVDLNTAGLYNLKQNFATVDKDGDGKAKPDELKKYAESSDANPLQKAMTERGVIANNDTIANYSSDRFTRHFGQKDEHIRVKDVDKGLEMAAAARPQEKLTEEQLAAKVKAPEFKAESLEYVKDNFLSIDANTNDKLDKPELQKFAEDPARSPLQKAYINDGVLPDFDVTANASKDNKLSFLGVKDSEIRKQDIDERLKTEHAKPEVQAAVKTLEPNDKLMELATVRKGEGPFHSAERILKAAGGKHGIDEVRALSNALKTMYNEEKHGDLKDLKVKHTFITKENFDKLVKSVNNEAAREALKKLAAA